MATYIANCLIILCASTFGITLILLIFGPLIEGVTKFPAQWIFAVIASSFFQFITLTLLSLWQMEGRAWAYGALQIFQTATNIALLAALVVGMQLGWQGGVLAQTISFTVTGLWAVRLLQSNGMLHWRVVPSYIKDSLRFGVPLIPHTIGATLIAMTDRVMIADLIGIGAAGVYAVGYQVGMLIALLQNSFNQAWVPWVYAKLNGNRPMDKRAIVRFTYIYFAAILILVVVLTAAAPLMLDTFIGKEFSGASSYVFWIGLGYAFNGMYKMVSVHIFYRSKTHLLAWVTAFTAILNMTMVYYAIMFAGAIGAAQATAFAFFVSFILTWILSARIQNLPWQYFRKVDQV